MSKVIKAAAESEHGIDTGKNGADQPGRHQACQPKTYRSDDLAHQEWKGSITVDRDTRHGGLEINKNAATPVPMDMKGISSLKTLP